MHPDILTSGPALATPTPIQKLRPILRTATRKNPERLLVEAVREGCLEEGGKCQV